MYIPGFLSFCAAPAKSAPILPAVLALCRAGKAASMLAPPVTRLARWSASRAPGSVRGFEKGRAKQTAPAEKGDKGVKSALVKGASLLLVFFAGQIGPNISQAGGATFCHGRVLISIPMAIPTVNND